MTIAYIGLGSNLDAPVTQLIQAIQAVAKIPCSSIKACSSLYGSKPMGPQDQPDYINSVLAISTELSSIALLNALQAIELNFGRVRKDERWGARVLDLDILLFGQEIINSDRLTVPHYGMKDREFVLLPLHEITQDLTLPCGESVSVLAEKIPLNGLEIKQKVVLSEII